MGMFSWLDCKDEEQIFIWDESFPQTQRTCYVLIPKEFGGGHLEEPKYEGYGVFSGEDVYALVARWNKPELCTGDTEHDRGVGIDIACYDHQNARLKYPIKITYDENAIYEDCDISKGDPDQGWVGIEAELEDDDWER